MSKAIRLSSMFLGKFIFIMLSVMASPHVYQEAKIKKKSWLLERYNINGAITRQEEK